MEPGPGCHLHTLPFNALHADEGNAAAVLLSLLAPSTGLTIMHDNDHPA